LAFSVLLTYTATPISSSTDAIPTKHRVSTDSKVVICMFLFQMRLRDDGDVDLITHQIRCQVLDSVRFGDGRRIQDVQRRHNTMGIEYSGVTYRKLIS